MGRQVVNRMQVSPVVKEERYFAPMNDAQGGDPAGDQSFWDRGVASNHKVPKEIAPRVDFPRWFPGESSRASGLAGGEDSGSFA